MYVHTFQFYDFTSKKTWQSALDSKYMYSVVGSSPTRGSSFFIEKVTALGVLCCFALFVCLTLLASFFLPSHLSFKNMYMYSYKCSYKMKGTKVLTLGAGRYACDIHVNGCAVL